MLDVRSISAWAVWHKDYEWGLDVPQLYPSKAMAIKKLTAGGVWPLQHGWNLIRVRVEHQAIPPSERGSQ